MAKSLHAEAAGIIDPETAINLVFARSRNQHSTHGLGRMMAVRASRDMVEEMLQTVEHVEIAAINSPRSVTIAGTAGRLGRACEKVSRVWQ